MTPGRFHLVLTVSLAGIIGFGASHLLSSNDAVAYPSGPTVSYGANPVFSYGGALGFSSSIGGTQATTVTPSATGQDAIITDVVLTVAPTDNCYATVDVAFTDSSSTLARFGVSQSHVHVASNGVLEANLGSGIRVAEGETLTLTSTSRYTYSCSGYIFYTLSGYYAEP